MNSWDDLIHLCLEKMLLMDLFAVGMSGSFEYIKTVSLSSCYLTF